MKETKFCKCGLPLINDICKRCGKSEDWQHKKEEKRERIKKYRGHSKNQDYKQSCITGWK